MPRSWATRLRGPCQNDAGKCTTFAAENCLERGARARKTCTHAHRMRAREEEAQKPRPFPTLATDLHEVTTRLGHEPNPGGPRRLDARKIDPGCCGASRDEDGRQARAVPERRLAPRSRLAGGRVRHGPRRDHEDPGAARARWARQGRFHAAARAPRRHSSHRGRAVASDRPRREGRELRPHRDRFPRVRHDGQAHRHDGGEGREPRRGLGARRPGVRALVSERRLDGRSRRRKRPAR